MGYSGEWVAVSGIEKEEILSRVSLRDTGEDGQYLSDGVSGAELCNGWYVLFGFEHGLVSDHDMEKLSVGCRLVCAEISESAMICCTSEYNNGSLVWEMTHEGNEDMYDLHVNGTPPPEFDRIRDNLILEQDTNGGRKADIDFIFDIPVDVAKAICGFRYNLGDILEDGTDTPFTILEPM